MKLIFQSLLLLIPFVFTYVWQLTPASDYTLQTIAILIAIFLIISFTKRARKSSVFFGNSIDIIIFTIIVLLIVLATGNYSSGVFFLLYFLCFGIAFVFEPATVFAFIIYTAVMFTLLQYTQSDYVTSNFLKLGSLVLIAPLAYFFGRELKNDDEEVSVIEAMQERSEDSADTISKDAEEILESEKANLKKEDEDKLNEIIEETETLREKTSS